MIGILCSSDKEKKYIEQLHSIVMNFRDKRDESIIVFTILNIDFSNGTVNGSLISEENIKVIQCPLPKVIFNMALQRDKKSVKGRKLLEEMKDIKFFNVINRYDQWMIMDLLSSSNTTDKYVLPYRIYDKQKRDFRPDDDKSYITMPAKGTKLSRVIFAQAESGSDRIRGTQYFKKGHICDYIDASMCQKRWLFIEVPELMLRNNHPVVVRVHMQKVSNKEWRLIGSDVYPNTEFEDAETSSKVDKAALITIKHIGNYLPSLGYCFIDFIVSAEDKPYFLHFGGFTLDLFYKKDKEEFYNRFYKNLLRLAGYYSRMHRED
jgi:hypothetical protein